MDRQIAWLIADAKLNPDTEVPEIFRPTSPKMVVVGFAAVILVVLFLASLGYVIYDIS